MTTSESIELAPSALRARRSAKWREYGPDVLPAWIAEMDYAAPPAVQASLHQLVALQDYGYARRGGGQPGRFLARAFASRMRQRYGWIIDPAHVIPVSDLAQAKAACLLAFSDEGDDVLVQAPCYPPFREIVLELRRNFVGYPWRDGGASWIGDGGDLEAALTPRSRILLLCHPHNPTGRSLSVLELASIGAVAESRGLVVVSDEVHADLVHEGCVHHPYAAASPSCAARTVTITSAAKAFNIPGLRCGVMHFGSAQLLDSFLRRIPRRLLGQPGIAGIDATVAAWEHGDDWLQAVRRHLADGRAMLLSKVAALGLRCHAPDATYFGWIDCSPRIGQRNAARFFLEHAGVAFSPGESFAPEYEHFIRFNFATSLALREQIWDRVEQALEVIS